MSFDPDLTMYLDVTLALVNENKMISTSMLKNPTCFSPKLFCERSFELHGAPHIRARSAAALVPLPRRTSIFQALSPPPPTPVPPRVQLMDENVLFYLEVSSFKTAGGGKSEYLTHVKRIYDMYIMPASAREVNISGAIHIATSAAVNTVLRDHPVAVRGAPCGAERRHNIECCDHEEDDRAQLQTAAACSKALSRSSVNKTIGREGEGSAAVEPIDGAGDSASTTTTSHRRNVGGVTSNEFAETETPARSFYRETCPLPPVPPSSPASQTRRRSLARIQGGGPKVDISSLSESDLSALLAPRTLDAEWIVAIGAKDSEDQELETEDGEARGRNDGDQDSARPDFADYRYGGSTAKMCVRDSTQEIENLGLGLGAGPGGGFGDRTIFDAAQNEIYEVLRTEVYPRFVANAIACGGVSSSTTTSGGDCHAICQGLVAPLSPPPPPPPSTPDLSTRSFKAVKGRGAGTGAAKK